MILKTVLKNEKNIVEKIEGSIDNKGLLVTYLNQHCFNIYQSNYQYKKLIDEKFTVFIDGVGIYYALKFLGFKDFQKINATDLHTKLFKNYSKEKTALFLIGGNYSDYFIKEKAAELNINIYGYQNGYFNDDHLQNIIDTIIQTSPEVIVIGMGVPKQEIVAAKIYKSIQDKIILCVGGFLEFYFGTKKRAPKWMQKSGLEWLHRLVSEPKRLLKRYIIGIPVFIFNILKLKLKNLKNKK